MGEQRIIGFALIVLSILIAKIGNELTTGVLLIPLGIYMMVTKKNCLND